MGITTQNHTGLLRRTLIVGGLCGGFALGACGRSAPSSAPKHLRPARKPGRVRTVTSGDSFILEDGRSVRLGAIEAPRIARKGQRAEPFAQEARRFLENLLVEKEVTFTRQGPDRYGRLRAHGYIKGEDGKRIWLQGALITNGLARVRTWRDDHAQADKLLALESATRRAAKGLWSSPYFAVRTPQTVALARGSFQIVQGRIVDAAIVRRRVYLNFGADWRKDFTISIAPKYVRSFTRAGVDLAGLSGALVRGRGLITWQGGPMLNLDHPAALEIL